VVDLDQLRQILDLAKEHGLLEFEIEQDGLRLRLRKEPSGAVVEVPAAVSGPSASPPPTAAVTPVVAIVEAGEALEVEPDDELAVVKSPIVGTFYRSPEPDAAPFVEIGSAVKKGQVLCIIEAMKLMNEIDSDHDGVVASIYVENGHPVQYGERLLAIRTR
jgi:acetyl-CoA carboxylase biotin carboxyl carrier protein